MSCLANDYNFLMKFFTASYLDRGQSETTQASLWYKLLISILILSRHFANVAFSIFVIVREVDKKDKSIIIRIANINTHPIK